MVSILLAFSNQYGKSIRLINYSMTHRIMKKLFLEITFTVRCVGAIERFDPGCNLLDQIASVTLWAKLSECKFLVASSPFTWNSSKERYQTKINHLFAAVKMGRRSASHSFLANTEVTSIDEDSKATRSGREKLPEVADSEEEPSMALPAYETTGLSE